MSKTKPYFSLFHHTIKPRFLLRCQNHCSQVSHALIQYRKLALEKIKKLRRHNKDRLSDLPDCVLLHILSFLNARDVVQTCLLSTRWKHLWKHLHTLRLTAPDSHHKDPAEFVNQILSLRNSSTALTSLDLESWSNHQPHLLESIVTYAVSHNVNSLRLYCLVENNCSFLSSLFSCRSLTSLDICPICIGGYTNTLEIFPNSLNLPSLTYLKLHSFSFSFCSGNDGRIEPFSTLNRLTTLILYKCRVWKGQSLCISSTTLLDLSIDMDYLNIELFAPSLCTFAFTGSSLRKLSSSHLFSIKHVSLHTWDIFNLLIEMMNIESLTVTPTTLQALSLVPDSLKLKLTCFCNLKSLKISLVSCGFSVMTRRDIKLELASGKS